VCILVCILVRGCVYTRAWFVCILMRGCVYTRVYTRAWFVRILVCILVRGLCVYSCVVCAK